MRYYSLNVQYIKGDLSAKLEDTEAVSIGLGIKY